MSAHLQAVRARFAGFELDIRSSELVKDGRRTRLQGQPFRVLCLLLDHAGDVVLREELRDLLWPEETFVDFDHGLNKAIAKLRDALDDAHADGSMIQTLPRRGYRFVPAVEWIGPQEESAPADSPPPLPVAPAPALEPGPARSAFSRVRLSLRMAFGAVALMALFWAWRAGWPHFRSRPVVQSIAVLPLQNLSNNPDEEYFADGMTDELITDLSHIRSLRVISRASVIGLKKAGLSVPEIADRLNVDAVVEGTILRSNNKVRITVQLVAAHPEQHLWAASYERPLGDAVTLQNEVASDAVSQIRTEVTPREHAQLQADTPVNPEAHDECLRGRFLMDQETPEQLMKAIPHFERAIQLAPRYADAYALLGEAVAYEGIDDLGSNPVTARKGVAYARQAIALDPNSAEAYEALGMSQTLARDWTQSEAMLRHSLALNPNNPDATEELAILLDMLHRGDEAVALMRQSAQANPVSIRSQRMFANVLYRARHFDEAIAQCRRVLELDPHRRIAYFILGNALAAEGRYKEAEEALRHLPEEPDSAEWLAALRGDKQQARRLLLQKQPKNSMYAPMTRYILGDQGGALAELDRLANVEWAIQTYFLNCDPLFDPMRGDPRFTAILKKTGLPE